MVHFKIHDALNLVVARFDGEVSAREIFAFFEGMRDDPQYRPSMDGVADMRQSVTQLNAEEVRELAQFAAEGGFKRGKWALLVTDPKSTAFSMLYRQSVGESYAVQVFSSVDGASDYLGRDLTGILD
jgi:hypothetical protein